MGKEYIVFNSTQRQLMEYVLGGEPLKAIDRFNASVFRKQKNAIETALKLYTQSEACFNEINAATHSLEVAFLKSRDINRDAVLQKITLFKRLKNEFDSVFADLRNCYIPADVNSKKSNLERLASGVEKYAGKLQQYGELIGISREVEAIGDISKGNVASIQNLYEGYEKLDADIRTLMDSQLVEKLKSLYQRTGTMLDGAQRINVLKGSFDRLNKQILSGEQMYTYEKRNELLSALSDIQAWKNEWDRFAVWVESASSDTLKSAGDTYRYLFSQTGAVEKAIKTGKDFSAAMDFCVIVSAYSVWHTVSKENLLKDREAYVNMSANVKGFVGQSYIDKLDEFLKKHETAEEINGWIDTLTGQLKKMDASIVKGVFVFPAVLGDSLIQKAEDAQRWLDGYGQCLEIYKKLTQRDTVPAKMRENMDSFARTAGTFRTFLSEYEARKASYAFEAEANGRIAAADSADLAAMRDLYAAITKEMSKLPSNTRDRISTAFKDKLEKGAAYYGGAIDLLQNIAAWKDTYFKLRTVCTLENADTMEYGMLRAGKEKADLIKKNLAQLEKQHASFGNYGGLDFGEYDAYEKYVESAEQLRVLNDYYKRVKRGKEILNDFSVRSVDSLRELIKQYPTYAESCAKFDRAGVISADINELTAFVAEYDKRKAEEVRRKNIESQRTRVKEKRNVYMNWAFQILVFVMLVVVDVLLPFNLGSSRSFWLLMAACVALTAESEVFILNQVKDTDVAQRFFWVILIAEAIYALFLMVPLYLIIS